MGKLPAASRAAGSAGLREVRRRGHNEHGGAIQPRPKRSRRSRQAGTAERNQFSGSEHASPMGKRVRDSCEERHRDDALDWRRPHPSRTCEPYSGGTMNRRIGILVVDRFELMRRAARVGVLAKRKPAVEIPSEKVFREYRGFDGVPWPDLEHPEFRTEDGLAALGDSALVDQYVRKLSQREGCDLVLLARLGADVEIVQKSGWTAAGFDLGYFHSEWSHFSVVLNEVLFGVHSALRSFGSRLNEHLLLGTLEDAVALLTERNQLAATGVDLEQGDLIEPIAMFLRDVGPEFAPIGCT